MPQVLDYYKEELYVQVFIRLKWRKTSATSRVESGYAAIPSSSHPEHSKIPGTFKTSS
jgi:hypothetical protein